MDSAPQLNEIVEKLNTLAANYGEIRNQLAAAGNGRSATTPPAAVVPAPPAQPAVARKPVNTDTDVLVAAVQTGLAVALSSFKDGWVPALAFLPAGAALLDSGVDGQGLETALAPALVGGAALLIGRAVR